MSRSPSAEAGGDLEKNGYDVYLHNMHELFLMSDCVDEDFPKATQLLQGLCEMAPVSIMNRRLLWEAPIIPKQKGFDQNFLAKQNPVKLPLWRALNEALARQAYHVNLVYEVSRDQFGTLDVSSEMTDEKKPTLDEILGTLYWADWPDPRSGRAVNSRTTVSIDNERGLCNLLRSMGYRLKNEIVEEVYRFIHGNVIILLHRYLDLPGNPQEKSDPQSEFTTTLPSYESLIPFDSDNKWIITARVDVLNGNDQEHVQKGIDELLSIKEAFEGCFDFPVLERRMLDTRVRA